MKECDFREMFRILYEMLSIMQLTMHALFCTRVETKKVYHVRHTTINSVYSYYTAQFFGCVDSKLDLLICEKFISILMSNAVALRYKLT